MSRAIPVLCSLLLLGSCVPAERPGDDAAPNGDASGARHPPRARPLSPPQATAGSDARSDSQSEPESEPEPLLTRPFSDSFDRESLGGDYFATSERYHLEQGRLCVKGAKNHPLWLRRRLPTNARIEVDAEAESEDGDIKLEAWGDGYAAATRLAYTDATSYLAIFGGWQNRFHVLARLDEHAQDRPEVEVTPGSDDPREQPVLAGRRYRLKLERSDGGTLRFWVDEVEILSFADPQPLAGRGHDHFAFNNWDTRVCFDNLRIEPLPS